VILHPGILALLLGAAVSLAMVLLGTLLGVRIARNWDPLAADERQLRLERECDLVAILVQWGVGFSVLSLPLFLYTADVLHPLFVGAMCATGTLNANPVGWWVLWDKLALFFVGSLWLVTNHYDRQAPDLPLTRGKFLALWLLLPLLTADLALLLAYFGGLHPEIITSCCGALFSSGGKGVASELASLPLRPMMLAYYASAVLFAVLLLVCRRLAGRFWRVVLALVALLFGAVGLASVVAFIAIYFYRLPSHHCPFDLLQGHYDYLGYPLYAFLFGAVFCGLVPLLLQSIGKPSLAAALLGAERRWLNLSIMMLICMLVMVSWPLLFGRFTMQAYF